MVAGGCGGSVGCLASTEGAICFTLGDDQWILRFASVMFGVSILRIFVGHRSLDLGCLDFLVNEEAFERNVLTTCYITVTLLKLDFLLRFHIISSKLTRFKWKSCNFCQRSSDPRPWKERQGLFFHMNQLGFFHAFGIWCMHPSGHSATFVGGRMFMFGGCQVTG